MEKLNKKNMQVEKVIKVVAAVVVVFAVVYGLVYVPAQQITMQKQALDRAETRVHNSCILVAQRATQEALANKPEGEEDATEAQINEFLGSQYAQCVAVEGYNASELSSKFTVAAEPEAENTEL